MDYLLGQLGERDKETDLVELIEPDRLCVIENFKGNKDVVLRGVKPVIIPDSCYAIMASYEDELVNVLVDRHSYIGKKDKAKVREHVRNEFCVQRTRACYGVDTENIHKELSKSFDKF